jgi:GTPase SAR1 family protein
MLGKNYKIHKENALNIYQAYKEYRGDTNDGVDIKCLQNRIDSLANNKFTLAVAGEVKAGKSTFLNALLKEELLPADVLQATSAIIEIFKSEKNHLKIKYADNTTAEFEEDCNKKLREVCCINDEYRDLPFTQINNYIQFSEDLSFEDLNIEELEKIPGVSGLNDKKELIEKYIEETPKNKIPVSISLGYPLKWDFDELRLVDSPGINATGGVENISYEYFKKANAIIFVRRISAIETKSFRDFVTKVIPDKNRQNLFLVLTNSGQLSSKEVERLTTEAKRLYREYIDEERIIAVDSILSLIHSQLENNLPLETILEDEEKEIAVARYIFEAKKKGQDLCEVLQRESGFQQMYSILEKYSLKAPNLQLTEILDSILIGYEGLEKIHINKIEILEHKKKSPQSFSEEIERQKEKLNEYQLLLNKGKNAIEDKYSGVDSKLYLTLNDTVNRYTEKIREGNSFSIIRKISTDAVNTFQNNLNEFTSEITLDLKSRMQAIAKDFESNHNIIVPKIDLNAIELRTKKGSFKIEDVFEDRPDDFWDKITFGLFRKYRDKEKKVGEKEVYDGVKHLETIKLEIFQHFQKSRSEIVMKSKEILSKYLEKFQSEFVTEIQKQKLSLNELKERKNDNEEILMEMNSLKKKVSGIPQQLKPVKEIINDIA